MKYRNLRIAWSVLWGVLAVLLVVLWVRSYQREDTLLTNVGRLTWIVQINSCDGRLNLLTHQEDAPSGIWLHWQCESPDLTRRYEKALREVQIASNSTPDPTFFVRLTRPFGMSARVPHWSGVLLLFGLAAAPWLRWRFTLRTLLIATMLIAIVLGLIVWLR
jgi:hypothetical protein